MNLWGIFPDFILRINGILYLSYCVLPFYSHTFYALVKHAKYRSQLAVFLIMTGIASVLMILTIGRYVDTIFAPLMLLVVMLMPFAIFIFHLLKNNKVGKYVWGVTTLTGCLHSISWAVWFFALAGS